MTPSKPRPTTKRPVIAPPLKATSSAGTIPFVAACAVLTLAFTDTFIPINPQAPESTAPITKPIAVSFDIKIPISTANTTPTIEMALYCLAR